MLSGNRWLFVVGMSTIAMACQPSSSLHDRTKLVVVDVESTADGQAVVAVLAADEAENVTFDDMVLVPEGSFWMGCHPKDDACENDEHPYHEVSLDAYYIDRTEVTPAQYRHCVRRGGCDSIHLTEYTSDGAHYKPDDDCNWHTKGRRDHPINCVSWYQAEAFCRGAGKRLPTEAEWEKAARGNDGRKYPWGKETPTCKLTVGDLESTATKKDGRWGCGKHHTWPVGSMRAGASPYGVLNMAGNVLEWVTDGYDRDYYTKTPHHNPICTTGERKSIRGGNWVVASIRAFRTSERDAYIPERRHGGLGFRCARSENKP